MTAFGTVARSFRFHVAAIHGPASFTAAGLPEGLSINATSGEITGSPVRAGVHQVSLTAANGHGSGSATLRLAIELPPPERPVLTSAETASGTVGKPFSYQIKASNAPTDFFVTSPGAKGTTPPASSLPPGLTYDTHSGLISGIPRTAGTYQVQIAAMNEGGVSISLITLTVR